MSSSDVMTVVELADRRLHDYVGLRDVELRTHLEAEHGLFIAEGEKVIRRAVTAGYRVRSFLMAPRWSETLRDVIVDSGAPCYVLPELQIERLTGFHVHRGALAAMHRRPEPTVESVLGGVARPAGRVVVCEDIVDHTNLGAIFRSAAGFGMDAVLLSPRCVDPLYRRSVKVSMGAVFEMPYARLERWWDGPGTLRDHGLTVVALTPADDAASLRDVAGELVDQPVALLFGTEGDGLSRRWLEQADLRVRIPTGPAVDSLNVAAASAVACYELAKGRVMPR